jgi:carbon monoxide dehydrogenase subunit G
MIENTTSMTLNHPPERVFDFLADFENEPAWNPECISVAKTSPGPAAAGTTYVGRMRKIGAVQMTLESHEPPRRFVTSERSLMATGRFEFRLMPHPSGTHLEVDAQLTPRGPFRLLQPLMRRELTTFLANLPGWIHTGLAHAGSRQSVGEVLDDPA